MSFLRRRFTYAGMKYVQFTVSGSFAGPTTAPCAGLGILGKKTSGSIGAISPGTFRGYTITDLDSETSYVDDGQGFCIPFQENVYFNLSGGGSLPKNFINRIEFLGSGLSLYVQNASYSGGNWSWVGAGEFVTGTVRIWYVG